MTTFTSVFGNEAVPPTGQTYQSITLAADTTYFWPELSTGVVLADINEVTASGAYSLTLPAANLTGVGRDLLFRNIGSLAFTIKDSAGNTIATVAAGEAKYLYITNNTTAAGLWSVFTYGTGSSGADASTLAGSGLVVSGATLALSHQSVSSLGDYTVQTSDRARTVTFSGNGAATCNLLSTSVAGDGFFILLTNQGTGSVTIDPFSTELIDGLSSKAFAPGESAFLVATPSGWLTVGYGRSTEFQFTKLVKDVTTGSPFTLTSVEAQNKLLQFIGTPTAAVTVNVPSVVAIYYVQCAYSGTLQLTLKTSSGAGVTLNGSDRVIAYCDGVNIVLAQTAFASTNLSLVDGTAANPSIFFTLDSNTGIFRAGTDTVGVAGNGAEVIRFSPSETLSQPPINVAAASKAQTRANLSVPSITEVQNSALVTLDTVAGTNTITAAATPALTSYVSGQTFRFTASGANTGAVTINIDGQGAKAITKTGALPLELGDIAAGAVVQVTYDGTQFQLVSGAGGGGAKANGVIYENKAIISADYTLSAGTNGHSVGPITINSGVAVTVPSGQRWVIV